jgi:hypothetical protein
VLPATPAVDFVEREKRYEISAELPGFDDKNVAVELSNGLLSISGEKGEAKGGEKEVRPSGSNGNAKAAPPARKTRQNPLFKSDPFLLRPANTKLFRR